MFRSLKSDHKLLKSTRIKSARKYFKIYNNKNFKSVKSKNKSILSKTLKKKISSANPCVQWFQRAKKPRRIIWNTKFSKMWSLIRIKNTSLIQIRCRSSPILLTSLGSPKRVFFKGWPLNNNCSLKRISLKISSYS
jgi:hypothetical protein